MLFRMPCKYFLAAFGCAAAISCGDSSGPDRESLSVVKSGSGSGTVSSSPAGITCGATCSAQFDRGTSVALTATPAAGSAFAGWEGCPAAGPCVVNLAASQTVTATFVATHALSVTKAGNGNGTITSTPSGITCGVSCTMAFNEGTTVTLTAVTPAGSNFLGWSGDCTGTGDCVVSMSTARAVTATFEALIGPPADIVVVSGDNQSAAAGTRVLDPIQIAARDEHGNGVPDKVVSFAVVGGDGSLDAATATTNANGIAIVPPWTLGRKDEPQIVRATLEALTEDVPAAILTSYNIVVRFYNSGSMTDAQKALFTTAAARLRAVAIGDIEDADARGGTVDPAQCGVEGHDPLNEIIDDVLIYASISSIDGPGKILAQAGPCFTRTTIIGPMTAIGKMEFDSADLETLTGGGSLQDVIMHEMLHVLGVGTLWQDRNLVSGTGYTGPLAARECRAAGGDDACALNVPLEDQGGGGTVGAHWRETTFNTELMTGFLDSGFNPLSAITIGGLEDLGFEVNYAGKDTYTVFDNSALIMPGTGTRLPDGWERVLTPIGVIENGRVRPKP
ncbi:MAG: InlB B-repeat-containing protein [Gemmatimonadaceae bacterium]